jgi:spore germination cell wall hydrolase CwlJ-like protein
MLAMVFRDALERLSGPHRWLLGLGALVAALGLTWYLGALASPTVTPYARNHAPTKPIAAVAPLIIPPQIFEKVTPEQAALLNAKVPFSGLPNPAARPFQLIPAVANDRDRAITCLTMAVYYEAANQGVDGQAAVAQVVLNRLRHPLFPKSVCGVVFQGSTLPTGCQFTFTCDGALARKPSDAAWKQALGVAERALNGYVEKSVGEATHYHTVWVVPYWQASVVKVAQIGAHIFYRWPGGMGMPGAFQGRYAGNETTPNSVDGLDEAAPVQVAVVDKAPPPVTVISAAPTIVAPPPPPPAPVQVAMLTTDAPVKMVWSTDRPAPERRDGYFSRIGGGQSAAGRLPMAR